MYNECSVRSRETSNEIIGFCERCDRNPRIRSQATRPMESSCLTFGKRKSGTFYSAFLAVISFNLSFPLKAKTQTRKAATARMAIPMSGR